MNSQCTTAQDMLSELLLWHMLPKHELAKELGVPIATVNGMLFRGQVAGTTLTQLERVYRRFLSLHRSEKYHHWQWQSRLSQSLENEKTVEE